MVTYRDDSGDEDVIHQSADLLAGRIFHGTSFGLTMTFVLKPNDINCQPNASFVRGGERLATEEDKKKIVNQTGMYKGLGECGRTLYIGTIFLTALQVLVRQFDCDREAVFFGTFVYW